MLIDYLSSTNWGDFFFYEVAPRKSQPNCGSFSICSLANPDFTIPAGTTGTINGAGITLLAKGKSLPYRLRIGNKSVNQLRLWQLGCHLPHTVVLDFSVGEAFKRDGEIDLRKFYDQVIVQRLTSSVAIRCSSNLEDSDAQSFAGVFDTYLNVPNQFEEIQERIFQSYQKFFRKNDARGDLLPYDVQLSIMVQQMIQPKFSGFLFTVDPVNPPSDWLKIEYWRGARENSKEYSVSLNRNTGKRVSSGRDSNRVVLPITIQEKLHQTAIELEQHFGIPQDVEFLISDPDDALFLVQSRPITAFSYSPDKVRVDEQQKTSAILEDNRRFYGQDPVLSSTNISELFNRAIPLGYSIFKYGFAGTLELDGGISIGRSRLGYAKLDPGDRVNLFYTVADQARTNLIGDALTFRLPGISKGEYLDTFVRYYLEQIKLDPSKANYPEDDLYLQTDDLASWLEIAGDRGASYCVEYANFLHQALHEHAPREYLNAGDFFQQSDLRYRVSQDRYLHTLALEDIRREIDADLCYMRTTFCPQYVVYARLAFLCTHLAKVRLRELMEPESRFTCEQILNELLRGTTIPGEIEGPTYPEFERLFKLGKIPLAEFLYRFQHLGSLDITQPRLGEYSIAKLHDVFGQGDGYGFVGEFSGAEEPEKADIDLEELGYLADPALIMLYTYAGRFMRLREKAKFELLKQLWGLKRSFIALAQRNRFGDLIYYLELQEALTLGSETREALRMIALQRKAYIDACQHYRVKDVLFDLQSTPFEENASFDEQEGRSRYRFVRGKTIFHGHAEGFCLTAGSNDEFIQKLAQFRARNIDNIVGVFKGVELSYFNMSALNGFTTENGGYLSHAATIAREFGLPYITDIRFNQYQDEDYIILDTEHNQVIIRR